MYRWFLSTMIGEMPEKNKPSSHHNQKKPLRSTWINTTAIVAMLAGVFSTQPGYNQDSIVPVDLKKKNTWELVVKDIKNISQSTITQIDSTEYQQLANETVKEINEYRKEYNLTPLIYSTRLHSIAQWYADYCVENNWEKGHYDKEGKGFDDRVKWTWYTGIAKENLYFGWDTPKEVVNTLKWSKIHNNNILFSRWKYISIGITKNQEDWSFAYVIIIFE